MELSSQSVAVIGAGPVGCLSALALARKKFRVTAFEANAAKSQRFAGEWLHPAGISVLCRLAGIAPGEIDLLGVRQDGFAVFCDDGGDPVLLNYPNGTRGIAVDHSTLVETLRAKLSKAPDVKLISGARVSSVEPGRLSYRSRESGDPKELFANRIVGADGRRSVVRKALDLPCSSPLISYMVGFLMHDVSLPHEGYGHVVLGAPGPILLYRISPTLVRVSIDVPSDIGIGKVDWKEFLTEKFCPYMPESLQSAFAEAVRTETLLFRANRYRPRIHYGNEELSLVGDAVGFQHPLTAMGMTLGFRDVEALVNHQVFSEFEKERRAQALVPELLAMALYRAFSGIDPGAREVRRAIYSMWRRYPAERERTMQLLSGELTSPVRFSMSFLHGMQMALAGVVNRKEPHPQWIQFCQTLGTIGHILGGVATCSSTRLSQSVPYLNPAA